MVEVQEEKKSSPAKSEVAQRKTRDAYGRFVSEEQKQIVEEQRKQMQYQAERARVSSLLGRTTQPMIPQMNTQPQVPQNNFQAILAANKPGNEADMDRWNKLLGRDTTSPNRRKKYRW